MIRRAYGSGAETFLRRPPSLHTPLFGSAHGRRLTCGHPAQASYSALRAQRQAAAEEAADNAQRAGAWKLKAAAAVLGTLMLVPGPYARWAADTSSAPSQTKGGALRRVAEKASAEGEGAPFHMYPFGHSVPSRALERCKKVGYDFANNSGIRWGMFCTDAYWNENASYAITPAAKTELEVATYTLHSMVLEMVDEIVKDESNTYMNLFEIPTELHEVRSRPSFCCRSFSLCI
jgi:hypothetical protein